MLVNIEGEKNDYDIIEIIKNSYGNVNLQNGEMSETEIIIQSDWSEAPKYKITSVRYNNRKNLFGHYKTTGYHWNQNFNMEMQNQG